MTSRNRLLVLVISTPVIAFAVIGGYLGQAMGKDDTYQHLRVFEDVVSLVLNNYVEPVDVSDAMQGAMRGLADGLDPDSAYLPPDLVKAIDTAADPGDTAEVGLDVIRQYYLRVVSARDGSPAAKAGIRPGDYIRAIDNRPSRGMSAVEGARLLRGAPGSTVTLLVIRGSAVDPHVVELVREELGGPDVATRMVDATTGYVRIVEFTEETPAQLEQAISALAEQGAARFVIDVRGTSRGDLDAGIAAARLFVGEGRLAVRLARDDTREPIVSETGDGAIEAPLVLLVDQGTAGPGEIFAAALDGNGRADLVGQGTVGRAARQRLIRLPDASGLWLTYIRYLSPEGNPIHETGLEPDVLVEQTELEFGATSPAGDATLQKALEHLAKNAA